MFGGDDMNPLYLGPMDNTRVPYNGTAVSPLLLDVHLGSSAGMMNVIGSNNASSVNLPMKLGSGAPIFSQQKFPVTLFDSIGQDDDRQPRSMLKQIPVSTGLKLSYGEEEHNSSISSAGESTILSSILSNRDNLQSLQTELLRQNDELDQYIRMQEENLRKGIAELKQRHTASLLSALEKEVDNRMRVKDAQIEILNRRNKELVETIRQIAIEAQSWHYKAKQNESLINVLRSNINQVVLSGAACVKQGHGENVVDDAASSCNPIPLDHLPNFQVHTSVSAKQPVNCKACKFKEMSVLLLPCRHLCLCTDCEASIDICPICCVKKAGALQVYMS